MSTMQPASPALTGLLLAAQAEPEGDDTSRLVLADFLDEHDDPRAEMVRLSTALARYHPGDPEWHDLSERLDEWQKRHLIDWLGKQGKVSLHRGLVRLELGPVILGGPTLATRLRTALEAAWIGSLKTHISGQYLAKAIGLGRLARVTALEIDGVYNADMECLGNLTHLRALSLPRHSPVETDGSFAFSAALPRLERLVLIAADSLTPTGLQQLSTGGCLRELELTRSIDLTEEHLQVVASLSKLRRLWLHVPRLPRSALVHLAHLQDLRWLALGDCSQLGPGELSRLAALPQLQHLSLFDCQGLECFARLSGLSSLSLYGAVIGEGASRLLAALPFLEELELTECHSHHGNSLAPLVELTDLKRLGWTRSIITEEELAPLLRFKALRWLNLSGSRGFSGAGLATLASLPELRRLDLSIVGWWNAAIPTHLSAMKQLRQLHLADGYIGRPTVEALAHALPQCRITVQGTAYPF